MNTDSGWEVSEKIPVKHAKTILNTTYLGRPHISPVEGQVNFEIGAAWFYLFFSTWLVLLLKGILVILPRLVFWL